MTENEAIDKLNNLHYKIVHTSFCNKVYESEIEALCMAKDCLKEIQQYRAIGTVEEFKALKEKSVAKKPIQDEHFQHDYSCSCCGGKLAESVDDNCCLEEEMAGWCPYCGQKLDWQ
jgi:hypothetical protein